MCILTTVRTVRIVVGMPDVKVYIRAEDLERWNSIEKKAEFLHAALNGIAMDNLTVAARGAVQDIPGVVKGSDFVPKPPDPELGYPCCQRNSPCKHWVWNTEKEMYINTLTGKEREPNL